MIHRLSMLDFKPTILWKNILVDIQSLTGCFQNMRGKFKNITIQRRRRGLEQDEEDRVAFVLSPAKIK